MPTLSIIIPTLNEQKYIQQCLYAIATNAQFPEEIEIIIIDAGSSDATLKDIPDNILVSRQPTFAGNKFESLNEGGRLAQGTYLLFLDADTLVPKDFDQLIIGTLDSDEIVGGAFEFAFDRRLLLLKSIEIINRIRYRFRQSYYGDQGIFVKKNIFDDVGGFPDLRIMEAAYLCRKLRKAGKLKLVKESIITSSRRFEEGGILKVFLMDSVIWLKNLLGMNVQSYASNYWLKNQ